MKTPNTLIMLMSQFLLTSAFAQVSGQQTQTAAKASASAGIKAVVILDNPSAFDRSDDEDDEWESSPSAPPLATDDPGTPGRRGIEVNFIQDCDHNKFSLACESVIDANFGIGEKTQLTIAKPMVYERADGEQSFRGTGATEIGVKHRFYEKDGLEMAFYPSASLDDGQQKRDRDGNELESEGRTVYLPLIVSKEFGKDRRAVTVIANVGYEKNLDFKNSDSIVTSVAFGHAVSKYSRIMGETVVECDRSGGGCSKDVRVGWVKVIFPKKSSRYQFSMATSVGIGKDTDGLTHNTVQVAFGVVRKPH